MNRLGRRGLALVLTMGAMLPFGASPALAADIIVVNVNEIDTSTWPPAGPKEPSGVTYIGPHLLVVDTNAEGINAWDYVVSTATPTGHLLGSAGTDEPTGVAYDAGNNRLFITSDLPNTIHVINNYTGTQTRTQINVTAVSGDTEDPAYDPATQTLYFLDGQSEQIHKVNMAGGTPVVDTTFAIDLSLLSLPDDGDWEGMTWNAANQSLMVAPNDDNNLVIYEIPTVAGMPAEPNNTYIAGGIFAGLDRINGLGHAPPSDGSGDPGFWITDRNSGGIFEFKTSPIAQTAPIAFGVDVASAIGVPFQTPIEVTLVATDSNNDDLTYEIVTPPAVGTGTLSGGTGNVRTFTPAAGYSGPASFQFRANDGTTNSNTATVNLNVHAGNQAPVLDAIAPAVEVDELTLLSFAATATDPNNDALTFSLVGAPTGASITPSGSFSWVPTEAQGPGVYTFNVRVEDPAAAFDTQPVQVTVREVGDDPEPTTPVPPKNPAFSGEGDFNEDGRSDLVTFDKANGRVWVFLSSGTSLLASQWTQLSSPSSWTEHLIGDFNGDGKDDIAHYKPSTGNWTVSRANSGGNGFTNSTWTTFSASAKTGWTEHLVGDFNNDGKDDIAHYRGSTGNWTVSRSTGTGFTNSTWTTFSGSAITGWTEHLVGDFNGDNRDDIVHYRGSTGNWTVSRSTGTGFTNSTWTTFSGSAITGWTEHLVGDFNGDNRDDIVHYRGSTGNWTVSRSTGTGFTNSTWTTFSGSAITGWTEHLVGDFSGDGKDDIVHYRGSTGNWTVSRSTGSQFTNSTWTTFTAKTGWVAHLVGNYNNDSRDDIAHLRGTTGSWTVSRSTGSGFTNSSWYP